MQHYDGVHEVDKINISQLKSPFRRNGPFGPNLVKNCDTLYGHVHKYEAAFGCGVDILMAVTFLSIVLFQKQNQKNDLV